MRLVDAVDRIVKARMLPQMVNVGDRSCGEIVENKDVVASLDVGIRQMRSDKACAAGDQDFHVMNPLLTTKHTIRKVQLRRRAFQQLCRVPRVESRNLCSVTFEEHFVDFGNPLHHDFRPKIRIDALPACFAHSPPQFRFFKEPTDRGRQSRGIARLDQKSRLIRNNNFGGPVDVE